MKAVGLIQPLSCFYYYCVFQMLFFSCNLVKISGFRILVYRHKPLTLGHFPDPYLDALLRFQ